MTLRSQSWNTYLEPGGSIRMGFEAKGARPPSRSAAPSTGRPADSSLPDPVTGPAFGRHASCRYPNPRPSCSRPRFGAGALGCGLINQVKQTVDNVSAITDLADRMGKSGKLTFTAEYKTDDGTPTTVVQQPPRPSGIGKDGVSSSPRTPCWSAPARPARRSSGQKSAVQAGQLSSADQAAYLSAVAGGGFINTEMALALMTAAAVVPGVEDCAENTATIAGQKSDCLDVTGIPQDAERRPERRLGQGVPRLRRRERPAHPVQGGRHRRRRPWASSSARSGEKVDAQAFVARRAPRSCESTAPPVAGKLSLCCLASQSLGGGGGSALRNVQNRADAARWSHRRRARGGPATRMGSPRR